MRHLQRLIACGCALIAGATLLQAQRPPKLGVHDFDVAGLTNTTDSAAVRRAFGDPDSISIAAGPNADRNKLIDWWYPDLRVSYNRRPTVGLVWLLSNRYHTARGIAVGDSVDQVLRCYGKATAVWIWDENASITYESRADSTHMVKFWLRNRRVTRIILEWE